MNNAARGRQEKYRMVGEQMCISHLFFNNFIIVGKFLSNFCQLCKNSGYLDTR
jgi:hypothetical protein